MALTSLEISDQTPVPPAATPFLPPTATETAAGDLRIEIFSDVLNRGRINRGVVFHDGFNDVIGKIDIGGRRAGIIA